MQLALSASLQLDSSASLGPVSTLLTAFSNHDRYKKSQKRLGDSAHGGTISDGQNLLCMLEASLWWQHQMDLWALYPKPMRVRTSDGVLWRVTRWDARAGEHVM
jgi:hypothetical protein